jgi:hypothetical protein
MWERTKRAAASAAAISQTEPLRAYLLIDQIRDVMVNTACAAACTAKRSHSRKSLSRDSGLAGLRITPCSNDTDTMTQEVALSMLPRASLATLLSG